MEGDNNNNKIITIIGKALELFFYPVSLLFAALGYVLSWIFELVSLYLRIRKMDDADSDNAKEEEIYTFKHDILPFDLLKMAIKWMINKILHSDTLHNTLLNVCMIVFVTIYSVLTFGWIHLFSLQADKNFFSWRSYVSIMLCTAAIHVWVYAILKNINSIKKLNNLFTESKTYTDKILPKLKSLVWPFPWFKGCSVVEAFVKIAFFLLWLGCSIKMLHACEKLHIFDMCSDRSDIVGQIIRVSPHVLMIIGMVLNYFSYYASIVFCYFTRMISNADDIKCESNHPWNSEKLRDLIHISSRSSISFFAVSMMYLVTVVVFSAPMNGIIAGIKDLNEAAGKRNEFILLLALTVFLCGVSFIVVSFLPKVFMNRLFRRWKYDKIHDLQKNDYHNSNKDDTIAGIWASSLPYVKMEVASAFLVFAVDFSALIVAILDLTK